MQLTDMLSPQPQPPQPTATGETAGRTGVLGAPRRMGADRQETPSTTQNLSMPVSGECRAGRIQIELRDP